jgi:hypothetical protein
LPTVTLEPDAVVAPVPMVEVHGVGALVSQVVVEPAVVQFAWASAGISAR